MARQAGVVTLRLRRRRRVSSCSAENRHRRYRLLDMPPLSGGQNETSGSSHCCLSAEDQLPLVSFQRNSRELNGRLAKIEWQHAALKCNMPFCP